MSIFDGLFRSKDKPQNRTAGCAYSFYMGGSSSGKAVTERSAMQMTAVYSCVRILSEAVVRFCRLCHEIQSISYHLAENAVLYTL